MASPEEQYAAFQDASRPERDESWEITNDSDALWAVRQIEAAESQLADRKALLARELEALQAHVEQGERQLASVKLRFEGRLQGYYHQLEAAGKILSHRKSWSLPGGRRLQKKKVNVSYRVVDTQAFLEWCAEHDLVEVNVKYKWVEAQKRFTPWSNEIGAPVVMEDVNEDSGEVAQIEIPGVEVERAAGEGFSVVLAKPKKGKADERDHTDGKDAVDTKG